MICEPCGQEIGPGQKFIAVLMNQQTGGLSVSIHCEHSEPPPDGAVLLASIDCAVRWFFRWMHATLKKCAHEAVYPNGN